MAAVQRQRVERGSSGVVFGNQTLVAINQAAVQSFKSGRYREALVSWDALLAKAATQRLTHIELHKCYTNRAAALVALGQWLEAKSSADEAICMLKRLQNVQTHEASTSLCKALWRKAQALCGLQRYQPAIAACEQGLELRPEHTGLRSCLQEAMVSQRLELAASRGMAGGAGVGCCTATGGSELVALGAATEGEQLCRLLQSGNKDLASAAVIQHMIDTYKVLPKSLLTPSQAERDHGTRDILNYVTVQSDILLPYTHVTKYLQDEDRIHAMQEAITAAVRDIMHRGLDCRVLILGAGMGLLPLIALQAGAKHVTCVERWLYLAQSCHEVLRQNWGHGAPAWKVVCKRPCDLSLGSDVPICCNLMVCDMLDDGLLGSGLVPSLAHCLKRLTTRSCITVPSAATVFAQAMQISQPTRRGIDFTALDDFRWWPYQTLPCPFGPDTYTPLTDPAAVWHFEFQRLPNSAAQTHLHLTASQDGTCNAVLFWYRLHLYGDVYLTTGPHSTETDPTAHQNPRAHVGDKPLDGPDVSTRLTCGVHEPMQLSTGSSGAPDLTLGLNHRMQEAVQRSCGPAVGVDLTAELNHRVQEAVQLALEESAGLDSGNKPSSPELSHGLQEAVQLGCEASGEEDDSIYATSRNLVRRESYDIDEPGSDARSQAASLDDHWDSTRLSMSTGVSQGILDLECMKLFRSSSLQPAVEMLGGGWKVTKGHALKLVARHNAIRMKFDVESCPPHVGIGGTDKTIAAAFPQSHFATAGDEGKMLAYQRAVMCTIAHLHSTGQKAHVADLGCGVGTLSVLAAQAGADSVTAIDVHPTVCRAARRLTAANNVADTVTVICKDARLVASDEVKGLTPPNIALVDLFTSGLLGDGVLSVLAAVNRKLLQPDAVIIPAAAQVYCMAVQVLTTRVTGFDLSLVNKHRWSKDTIPTLLQHTPHVPLTSAISVGTINFQTGAISIPSNGAALPIKVIQPGVMNAVVFWYDLYMDPAGRSVLTSAPEGFGPHGCVLEGDGRRPACAEPQSGCEAKSVVDDQAASNNYASSNQGTLDGDTVRNLGALHGDASRNQAVFDDVASRNQAVFDDDASSNLTAFVDDASSNPAAYDDGASSNPAAYDDDASSNPAAYDDDASSNPPAYDGDAPSNPTAANHASNSQGASDKQCQAYNGSCGPGWHRSQGGQFLQYLDSMVGVAAGQEVALVCSATSNKIHFQLPAGVGHPVPRSPWKEEWGGGASVENPHYQRVHYCQLLINDFLMRLPSGRFPSAQADVDLIAAHCGSLALDPATLGQVHHFLALLEALYGSHQQVGRTGNVTPEAVSHTPLQW